MKSVMLKSINPYTNELINEYSVDSAHLVVQKIDELTRTYLTWKKISFAERAIVLNRIADSLTDRSKELGKLITMEMGKPLAESIAEIEKCAWVCKYYAENGERFLKPKMVQTEVKENKIIYQSIGVVLAIMPWNFPFWQVFRCIAPNIMLGNVVCLKHASNVQGCAIEIEKIVFACSNESLVKNLVVPSSEMKSVVSNPNISAVTLTGSEFAGKQVAALAGKYMKKCVFELGGSDAFIVLEDANINEAVRDGVISRYLNSGQSCIAAKRFIIEDNIYEEFKTKFINEVKKLTIGDPAVEGISIGPLANKQFALDLKKQIDQCVEEGGVIDVGGKINGTQVEPTIISNLTKSSFANSEEFFGPVALLFKVKNESEAIELANNSRYGLSSSIWTEDVEKAEILAEQIEAGAVFINQFSKSDPRLPFGGIKYSGYGRELGEEGIKEFANVKTISIA